MLVLYYYNVNDLIDCINGGNSSECDYEATLTTTN